MLTSDPRFLPPFCPEPTCRHHRDPTDWRWRRDGTHARKAPPHVVSRFRCMACGRSFSTQTFDAGYWLKKPHLLQPLFLALAACSGFRQIGRSLGVAATTLQRQAARLGRHCLLYEQVHRPKEAPQEDVVLDGLVSFEYSQYWPFEINVLVGEHSYFTYGFTDSELRRSGRMTLAQKARREQLEKLHGRPDPQATMKAVRALLLLAVPEPVPLRVRSDEHQAYPRAFRGVPHAIEHLTVSSRRCRTARNPLFAVDLFDLLTRHGSANHKRETIAFSKRRQGALDRMAIQVTWRNRIKRRSERRLDSLTPAQVLKLTDRPLTVGDVLARRLFPSHVTLPQPHAAYYWRNVATRQAHDGPRHALKYAA